MRLIKTAVTFLFVAIVLTVSIPVYVKGIVITLLILASLKDQKKSRRDKISQSDEENRKILKGKEIFFLAERLDNRVTIEDVTIHTSLDYDSSKRELEILAKKGVVKPMITDEGIFVYQFPEMPYCPKVVDLSRKSESEILERMLTYARESNKTLSIAALAKCTTLEVDDIIKLMDKYCKKGLAKKSDNDIITYQFPGLLSEDEKREAKEIW